MTIHVLIVEDDVMLQEWVDYELKSEGYQSTIAGTGLAGLQAAQNTPHPDIILLDVQLPGMDGFSVAQELQQNPTTADIPIIFLTARAALKDKMAGFEAGGLDYLTKPFSMAELKARIKATLHRGHVEREKAQEDLDIYKRNLSQNISHELLTPMAKILNGLDVIKRTTQAEQLDTLDEPINNAVSGAHELRWLIEDLLLINRFNVESVKPFRQEVNLMQVIQTIIEQIESKYQRNDIHFNLQGPVSVRVNIHRKHVLHIFHHLLDNAAKFSHHGDKPQIVVQRVGQMGATVTILDEGVGIPAEALPHVFERFYQADMGISRPKDGLGVGLYVAQTLARLYDGEISLRSHLNSGTTCLWTISDQSPDWQTFSPSE